MARQSRNRRTNRRSKRETRSKRTKMNGGQFSVPISKFYPQNTFEHDPSRVMASSVLKGGKKHSRKYLRGGNSGFFSQFGSPFGASQVAGQVTGFQPSAPSLGPFYKV